MNFKNYYQLNILGYHAGSKEIIKKQLLPKNLELVLKSHPDLMTTTLKKKELI